MNDHVDQIISDLVEARKLEGLRQADIAKILGVGQPAVSQIESGNTSPRLGTIIKYAAAVGYRITVTEDSPSDD